MRKIILALSLALLMNSCAYYNTFFNAKKYFAEAQEIPLRDTGRPDSNAIKKYNKCIKKCGIILTDYKESEWADDALSLLAKSLFFKKSNFIQAKEKFGDIINFYPQSEFADEAHLYIARSDFELKNKEEAFIQLQDILSNPELSKIHSETMFVTADYYLQEDDHIQAEYYYKRIIEEFPDSEEFEKAYIALGESYHKSEKYQLSNEIISELLKNKKVGKKNKLDARYIFAYNLLLSKEYESALKASKKLLKNEYRVSELPKTHLLEARSLEGVGNIDKAITHFEAIIEKNQRSKISAEAAFFLGELYFNSIHDYEKAIEFYNKARTEYTKTKYKKSALTRSAAAGRIIQYNNPDRSMSIQSLTDEYFKLAEFYLDDLALPDSALMVYNTVILQVSFLEEKVDSLQSSAENYWLPDSTAVTDSLSFENSESDSLMISEYIEPVHPVSKDSVFISKEINPLSDIPDEADLMISIPDDSIHVNKSKSLSDSLLISEDKDFEAKKDSSFFNNPDTLMFSKIKISEDKIPLFSPPKDSINVRNSVPVSDSLILTEIYDLPISEDSLFIPDSLFAEDSLQITEIDTLEMIEETIIDSTEYKLLLNKVTTAEYELELYNTEIIPMAKLMKVWTYKKVAVDSAKAVEILSEMKADFPADKYTNAAISIVNNKKINMVSTKEMQETIQFEQAMETYESDPENSIEKLKIIAEDYENIFYVKALYSIGYLNYYALSDTTEAKLYFDEILEVYGTTEFSNAVRKFYDGTRITKIDRLPMITQIENEKAQQEEDRKKQEEQVEKDKLEEEKRNQDQGQEQEQSEAEDTENWKPNIEDPVKDEPEKMKVIP